MKLFGLIIFVVIGIQLLSASILALYMSDEQQYPQEYLGTTQLYKRINNNWKIIKTYPNYQTCQQYAEILNNQRTKIVYDCDIHE